MQERKGKERAGDEQSFFPEPKPLLNICQSFSVFGWAHNIQTACFSNGFFGPLRFDRGSLSGTRSLLHVLEGFCTTQPSWPIKFV